MKRTDLPFLVRVRVAWLFVRAFCVFFPILGAHAEVLPARGDLDSRIRTAGYSPDEVYRLQGYVGYQIDLQFESGETFVGLAAGDLKGLAFVPQDNHLFLKPKAAKVETNLTVLTNRRHYHFEYTALAQHPDPAQGEVIYSLRFTYPPPADVPAAVVGDAVERELGRASEVRPRNTDYWYCGHSTLKPVTASDDGVHTSFRFGARGELPAIFVRNDDGSESLLNFNMDGGEVVIHRVAQRFVLRRGLLRGCVVNKSFNGGGERLDSGTVSPEVVRTTQGVRP